MKLKLIAITVALLASFQPIAHGQSMMDTCRAYARAIEAVALARDNLDEPSWEKLVELHPILKKDGEKNKRAVLYARMINLRMTNKKATPQTLKMSSFEQCPATYSCFFEGEGCGPKK